jgi:molecular chaperone GrpE
MIVAFLMVRYQKFLSKNKQGFTMTLPAYLKATLKKEPNSEDKENEKCEEISSEKASLNDKYFRLMAEFENFKRRSEKDSERLKNAANERLIYDLIEILENFKRALKSPEHGEKFFQGARLNFQRFEGILQKYGLEEYAQSGDEFNPELHDAVMSSFHELVPDSSIIEVLEQGYRLQGKIIKHAKVVVSRGALEKNKPTRNR